MVHESKCRRILFKIFLILGHGSSTNTSKTSTLTSPVAVGKFKETLVVTPKPKTFKLEPTEGKKIFEKLGENFLIFFLPLVTTAMIPSSVDETTIPGGILKRKGSSSRKDFSDFLVEKDTATSQTSSTSAAATTSSVSPTVPVYPQRKRSILKHDSFEASEISRLKGVLKKDSSYDDGLKPILKNNEHGVEDVVVAAAIANQDLNHSSSSSEDISKNAPFSDVIIDPIPKALSIDEDEDSAAFKESKVASVTTTPVRKPSLKDRQPVIPPSSVKISAEDRNLANKLEQLAEEAESIRKRQLLEMEESEKKLQQQEVNRVVQQPKEKR